MKRSRILFVLLAVLLWVALCPLQAAAEEAEAVTMPPAYGDLADAIPPELSELLPDGLFSEDAGEAITAATELTDWRYLLNTLMSAVGLHLDGAVWLFCVLMGLILIAAVCGRLRDGLGGGSGELFGFCLRLALYTAMILQTAGMVETVTRYFDRLITLTGGMIPVMGTLYALGGNPGQAAVTSELMLVFLTVCQYVSVTVTPPVCAVCMSFSLMDAMGIRLTLSSLCDRIKKWYASLLGLVMFLLSLALSTQSVLAGQADSLGMKGVKYAVGNMIPMVGGAVAGTLSTVAAGVTALRGICGVSGIILVALLLLPTLAELLLTRAILNLAGTVASMLTCDGEAKLISEMASLHGYLAAAASICAVVFVIALTLLIHSGTALS